MRACVCPLYYLGIVTDGTVPGSIYSDLYNAGGILNGGPLLYRFNDDEYRWVSYLDWDYSLQFSGKTDHNN